MNQYRCAEGQALRICLKDRCRRAIAFQRVEDFPKARVPPFRQVHFLQKIPDAAIAVSPVEYPIGPQALL